MSKILLLIFILLSLIDFDLLFSICVPSLCLIIESGKYRKGSGPIGLTSAPLLANVSAVSLPNIPMWALTLYKVTSLYWRLFCCARRQLCVN